MRPRYSIEYVVGGAAIFPLTSDWYEAAEGLVEDLQGWYYQSASLPAEFHSAGPGNCFVYCENALRAEGA